MAGKKGAAPPRKGLSASEIGSLPTIRSMDFSKERIRKRKAEIKENRLRLKDYQIEMLSAPIATAKSVSRLKGAISVFFEAHSDDPYVTPNELALALGYSSYDALERDINSPNCEPEYRVLLEAAVAEIESLRERRMLAISDMMGDIKGYDSILQRMDKVRAQRDPDLIAQNTKSKGNIAIGIQIAENEAVKGIISDKISALMDKLNSSIPPAVPQGRTMEEAMDVMFTEVADEQHA